MFKITLTIVTSILLLATGCQDSTDPVEKESALAAEWRKQFGPQFAKIVGEGIDIELKSIEEFEEDGAVLLRAKAKATASIPFYGVYDGSADLHARMVELGWKGDGFPKFGLRAPTTIRQVTAVGESMEFVAIGKPRYGGTSFEILDMVGDESALPGKSKDAYPFPQYIELGTPETDEWILKVFEADRKMREDSKIQESRKIEIQ